MLSTSSETEKTCIKICYDPDRFNDFCDSTHKKNGIVTTTVDRKRSNKRVDLSVGDIVVFTFLLGGEIYAGQIYQIKLENKECSYKAIVWGEKGRYGFPSHKRGDLIDVDSAFVTKGYFKSPESSKQSRGVFSYNILENDNFIDLEKTTPDKAEDMAEILQNALNEKLESMTCLECKKIDILSNGEFFFVEDEKLHRLKHVTPQNEKSRDDNNTIYHMTTIDYTVATLSEPSPTLLFVPNYPTFTVNGAMSYPHKNLCSYKNSLYFEEGSGILETLLIPHKETFQTYISEQLKKFKPGIKTYSTFKREYTRIYPGRCTYLEYLKNFSKEKDSLFLWEMYTKMHSKEKGEKEEEK